MLVGTVGKGTQVHMVRLKTREDMSLGYVTLCPAKRLPGEGDVGEGEKRDLTCQTCLRILTYGEKTRKEKP